MSYRRVIPRDLFNESKLLKCLGQLSLLAHDGQANGLRVSFDDDGPFHIVQDDDDGGLYCSNVWIFTHDGNIVSVKTRYNSKSAYPLVFNEYQDVFNDDGTLTEEFIDHIK